MGSEVIVIPIFFGVILAIAYLYFTTRNKERMALIEKGADASIFVKGRSKGSIPFWKIIILNIAFLFIGIGLAIFLGTFFVDSLGMDEDVAYPATIFMMAGLGLLGGFTMTKRLEKED